MRRCTAASTYHAILEAEREPREIHKATQIVAMARMTRRAPQIVSCQLSSSLEGIVVLRCEFVLSSSDFMPGD